MDITIEENPFSLRSEYEMSTPGCIYFAQKKFFSWREQGLANKVLAGIGSRFSLFRSRYDFELSDGISDTNLYAAFTSSQWPAGGTWVFDHPFFIIVNVAVGGNWPGAPDATTVFPQTMLVDYVRVYKHL